MWPCRPVKELKRGRGDSPAPVSEACFQASGRNRARGYSHSAPRPEKTENKMEKKEEKEGKTRIFLHPHGAGDLSSLHTPGARSRSAPRAGCWRLPSPGPKRRGSREPRQGCRRRRRCRAVSSISGRQSSDGPRLFLEFSQRTRGLPWPRALCFCPFPPFFFLRPSQVLQTRVK